MSIEAQFSKAAMVRFERTLPGPIERAWELLTNTERLPGWFGPGIIEPREGGAVTLMGGHIRGVVTQWKPPRILAYTWNVFSPGETESSWRNPMPHPPGAGPSLSRGEIRVRVPCARRKPQAPSFHGWKGIPELSD